MWIGVHGCVYDVTSFLPIHPGGTLIVAASAGLDCSQTFDEVRSDDIYLATHLNPPEVGHTSNPEVASLLGKYFIGYLVPPPKFSSPELTDLYKGTRHISQTWTSAYLNRMDTLPPNIRGITDNNVFRSGHAH